MATPIIQFQEEGTDRVRSPANHGSSNHDFNSASNDHDSSVDDHDLVNGDIRLRGINRGNSSSEHQGSSGVNVELILDPQTWTEELI